MFYEYDWRGNLSGVRDENGNMLAAYAHTPGGRLKEIRHGNGIRTGYEYDTDGNLVHLHMERTDGEILADLYYSHDLNGNRTLKSGSRIGGEGKATEHKISYVYDRMDRLVSETYQSGSNPKNVFPENPDDLLPEIPRNKATKANGTTSQTIQTSNNIRIRAEQHPLLPGETYNPRHHGVHYHVEYKVDPTKSWNNKNNVKKWYPEGYTPGAGSGFIPGEPFPE